MYKENRGGWLPSGNEKHKALSREEKSCEDEAVACGKG